MITLLRETLSLARRCIARAGPRLSQTPGSYQAVFPWAHGKRPLSQSRGEIY
jgi:hypothetical protein